ncbi:hypothetical protein FNF31_04690 [Cafeteria roenbergensis]|uniref:Uncharacterized protein n=1 Tax=Cafeteria roenbergensis TaxID=33653 RepID=A0A5A8CLZ6_CAFRO|nr:hypothetical protein FNF28_06920 [Cafeteria roenbergensis]KAA0159889.1 hypothetical protein FNF31_04690 [Cafeteria roenbergensis]
MAAPTTDPVLARSVRDVAYVPTARKRQLLDLFVADSPLPGAPLVLFVHGGGWKRFSKQEHAHIGRAWAKLGITTAVMSYRISGLEESTRLAITAVWSLAIGSLGFLADATGAAPGWLVASCIAVGAFSAITGLRLYRQCGEEPRIRWPAHREDVVSALKFLGSAAQAGGQFEGLYNPRNVFVCGHSAGAHMTLMTCFDVPLLAKAGIGLMSLPPVSPGVSPPPVPAESSRPAEGRTLKEVSSGAAAEDLHVDLVPESEWSLAVPAGCGAPAKPGLVIRGVIAMSPPAVSAMMSGFMIHRMYMRPAFGFDPAQWPQAFPDALLRTAVEEGRCPRPPLLLATADPGYDLGLEKHVDELMPILAAAKVPATRITITGSNHFTEMTRIGVPGTPAESIMTPALVAFVEEHGVKRHTPAEDKEES